MRVTSWQKATTGTAALLAIPSTARVAGWRSRARLFWTLVAAARGADAFGRRYLQGAITGAVVAVTLTAALCYCTYRTSPYVISGRTAREGKGAVLLDVASKLKFHSSRSR